MDDYYHFEVTLQGRSGPRTVSGSLPLCYYSQHQSRRISALLITLEILERTGGNTTAVNARLLAEIQGN